MSHTDCTESTEEERLPRGSKNFGSSINCISFIVIITLLYTLPSYNTTHFMFLPSV